MENCYIFSITRNVEIEAKGEQAQNHLVIFFPYKNVNVARQDIQLQLREYFFNHILPDKLIVLCLEFNKVEVAALFTMESEIYNYIPRFELSPLYDNLSILSLSRSGDFDVEQGNRLTESDLSLIYNRGMVKIFNQNGGLIVAHAAHHFVFPSGKHCDRFLRTGNVLIHGAQIQFIASALVRHFKGNIPKNIYCDTSSINSLAYSYVNLLRDLDQDLQNSIQVDSFGSYEMFEKSKLEVKRDSIFLISSSTSGSILKRMTDTENRKRSIQIENIAVIYGLNVESTYSDNVICDLTLKSESNPDGIREFVSYNVKNGITCQLCENGSKAVQVKGDVFLLERPVVTGHRINVTDAPAFLRDFGEFYAKEKGNVDSIVRCFYKEDGIKDKKYEIYIDIEGILAEWTDRGNGRFKRIFAKLEKYILQNIPASLKYMIVLPDNASRTLAGIISDILNEHNISFDRNNIIEIKDIKEKVDQTIKGVIAVVSSSIVTGRNLLYVSRALREYEQSFQRMFFTFINRTARKDQLEFLESNLGLGEFGKGSHKIVNVENIFCRQEAQNTPWHKELNFIKQLQEFCESHGNFNETINYCSRREIELNESGKHKGLGDNLFFPSLESKVLKISRGFAFAPKKQGFIESATQSEIYFIISSILNELRSNGKFDQSEYVKNILEPGNFVRYNDGVIQASILRAANDDELRYDLSPELSVQMQSVIGDMIDHIDDRHAEALNEFFYAIAIKKLKLPSSVLADCIQLLEEQNYYISKDFVLKGIVAYIKSKVLVNLDIQQKFMELPIVKD